MYIEMGIGILVFITYYMKIIFIQRRTCSYFNNHVASRKATLGVFCWRWQCAHIFFMKHTMTLLYLEQWTYLFCLKTLNDIYFNELIMLYILYYWNVSVNTSFKDLAKYYVNVNTWALEPFSPVFGYMDGLNTKNIATNCRRTHVQVRRFWMCCIHVYRC